jgi:hypothetical protein
VHLVLNVPSKLTIQFTRIDHINEITSCGSDSDIATVESVSFDPPNPIAGKDLKVTTTINLKETLEKGYSFLLYKN